MRNVFIVLPVAALIAACSPTIHSELVLSVENRDEAAQFILTCAKNANPMSDEEGEDLVAECAYTAKQLYGVRRYYAWDGRGQHRVCEGYTTTGEVVKCLGELK